MAGIRTIREALDSAGLTINNIQKLDTAPEMTAALLKAEFDKNVNNLVEAFDTWIAPYVASQQDIEDKMIALGSGDMQQSVYAAGDGALNDNTVDHAVFADSAENDAEGNDITGTYATKTELAEAIATVDLTGVMKTLFPVNSVKFSVDNVNPGTYIPGTTWVAWGSGRIPVGFKNGDSNFGTAEGTGGKISYDLSHTHSVAAATSGATTLATSQIPAHTHTFTGSAVNTGSTSHTHSFSATTGSAGAHSHYMSMADYRINGSETSTYRYLTFSGNTSARYTNSVAGHTHSVSGTTGSTSHYHSVTAAGTNANTGGGGSHTHSIPKATTGSAGSADQSIIPPYIVCYMWKRTA